ncbi:MAG: 1-acyl-sn-glycerol-3-phosphate acyltransferase [Treponema sp.]|jgi:1-acyl-sn-glycerol-3-phosphate acyltransferase|nr:1-acyl-sn-glycerol-3-phosphate acyltransferase [Treponema sp.]
MGVLKTIGDFTVVVVAMIALVPLGVLLFILSCLGLEKPMSILIYKVAQGWSLLLIKCTRCTLTVIGKEHIPPKGGLCLVSNHNSIFDIVLLLGLIGRPVGFIAKKELAWIPVLNMWMLLLGCLFIDRKNIRKAVGTINTGIQRIKRGGAMIIFPEGTRSKGRGLLPFRTGSLKLATQSGAPIVPVAITGSYEVFEKTYRVQAVPVGVRFLAPINTAELPLEDRRQNLSDQIQKVIAKALESLTVHGSDKRA